MTPSQQKLWDSLLPGMFAEFKDGSLHLITAVRLFTVHYHESFVCTADVSNISITPHILFGEHDIRNRITAIYSSGHHPMWRLDDEQ